jgi:hypothetical protein
MTRLNGGSLPLNAPRSVLIRLVIEKTQPLVGTAAAEGGDPVPFDGWLEMLRVISELVVAAGPDERGR